MGYNRAGHMGSGSIHMVASGRQADHNQDLAEPVRPHQHVGT